MTAADRQRRYRDRRATGVIRLALDLPEDDLVAALIEAKLLFPNDADDRAKVAAAAERFVSLAIRP